MPVETEQIAGLGTRSTPFTYTVPNAQSFDLIAVSGVWDGTGAAGAFLPCVQIFSAAGLLMAQAVGSSVAAGSSADVTFAPFLEAPATAAAGGLQYTTSPQTGTWFYADVTGSGGPEGWGWEFKDVNGNGTAFNGIPILFGDYNGTSNGTALVLNSTGQHVTLTGNQRFDIATGTGTVFRADNTFAGNRIGFFGVTPVVKQATPVTLADVIALLQAYGLAV